MAFSLLSIIISILSLSSRRSIARSTDYVSIEFYIKDITNARKHRNRVKNVKYELSSLLGINSNLMEIHRPTNIQKGLKMVINIRINNTKQIDMNIEKSVNHMYRSGELAELIKSSWSLSCIPLIENLKCIKHEPRHRRDNTVYIRAISRRTLTHEVPSNSAWIQAGKVDMVNYLNMPTIIAPAVMTDFGLKQEDA